MAEHDQPPGRAPVIPHVAGRSGDQDAAGRGDHHEGGWRGVWWVAAAVLAVVYVASATGPVAQPAMQPGRPSASRSDSPGSPVVFTPAHRSVVEAIRDFLGVRPAVVQPIAFPHNVHTANRLGCTDYCHASAALGPIAGLPSVKTCMICHGAGTIATDRAEVACNLSFRFPSWRSRDCERSPAQSSPRRP